MEKLNKILRVAFYTMAAVCVGLYIAYQYSEPHDEDFFLYFIYCGICAMGLSILRFVLRFF